MMASRASRSSKGKNTSRGRNPKKAAKPGRTAPSRKARAKPRKTQPLASRHVRKWSKPKIMKKPPQKAAHPEKKPKRPPEPKFNAELDAMLSNSRVRQMIVDSGGESALEIMRAFTRELSDDDLAKKLKIKISDVRATLNRLHNLGIVQYNRYKDAETGWFSYFWSINMEKTQRWMDEQMAKEGSPGDLSTSEYYFCPKCGSESLCEFATASDYSFRCPLCNRALEFVDDNAARDLFPRGPKRPV